MTTEGLQLRARDQGPLRCAYCREDMDEPAAECSACGVRLHEACARELDRCPTVGCGAARPGARELQLRLQGTASRDHQDVLGEDPAGCGCILEALAISLAPILVMLLREAGGPVWLAVLPIPLVFLITRGLIIRPGPVRSGALRIDGPIIFGRDLAATLVLELENAIAIQQVRVQLALRIRNSFNSEATSLASSPAIDFGPYAPRTGRFEIPLTIPIPSRAAFPSRQVARPDPWQLTVEVEGPARELLLALEMSLSEEGDAASELNGPSGPASDG